MPMYGFQMQNVFRLYSQSVWYVLRCLMSVGIVHWDFSVRQLHFGFQPAKLCFGKLQ
jgi:hypothetical protein